LRTSTTPLIFSLLKVETHENVIIWFDKTPPDGMQARLSGLTGRLWDSGMIVLIKNQFGQGQTWGQWKSYQKKKDEKTSLDVKS
jgi:hypothetical protein